MVAAPLWCGPPVEGPSGGRRSAPAKKAVAPAKKAVAPAKTAAAGAG
jgi:hypothetical protein